jgi:hypothetical protein
MKTGPRINSGLCQRQRTSRKETWKGKDRQEENKEYIVSEAKKKKYFKGKKCQQ